VGLTLSIVMESTSL